MKIEIRMFATLSCYNSHNRIDEKQCIDVQTGITVKNLIEILEIPVNDIKLIFVNGRHSDIQKVLLKDDRVGLFPPIGGG